MNISFIGLIPEYCALFILCIIMYLNNRKTNSKVIKNVNEHIINKNFVNCEITALLLIIIDIIRYSTTNSNIEYVSAILFHCAIVIMANTITTYIYDLLPTLKDKSIKFYNAKTKITYIIVFIMTLLSPTGFICSLRDGQVVTGKIFFFSYLVGAVMFGMCIIGAYKVNVSRRIKNAMYLTIVSTYIPCIFEMLYRQSITSGIGFVAGLLLLYHLFQDGVFDMTYGTESFVSMIKYMKSPRRNKYKVIVFTITSINKRNKSNMTQKHQLLLDLKQKFESETMFKSNNRYAFVLKNMNFNDISNIWSLVIDKYTDNFICKAIVVDRKYIDDINVTMLSKMTIDNTISNFEDKDMNKIERIDLITRTILEILDKEDYNDDRIVTVVQPIINLKENKFLTGEILTRLKVRGIENFVMPYEFIPIIEDLNLVHAFNLRVLNNACKLMKTLQNENIEFDSISVNFDPIELTSSNFTTDVSNIVYRNGISPKCIHIEITETTEISDIETTNQCINELTTLGFSIYLDDFGTKYSNLTELFNCNFNVIKIDRQLILKALEDEKSRNIITALSSACNAVGYEVLFEGVDSELGVELARNTGASYIQGYYYSKPLSNNEFIQFVKRKNTQLAV